MIVVVVLLYGTWGGLIVYTDHIRIINPTVSRHARSFLLSYKRVIVKRVACCFTLIRDVIFSCCIKTYFADHCKFNFFCQKLQNSPLTVYLVSSFCLVFKLSAVVFHSSAVMLWRRLPTVDSRVRLTISDEK